MKKILLVTLLTVYSFGYTITNEFWVDNTGSDRNKQINITCNGGDKGYIYYFPNNNGYYAKNSNNKFSSMDAAASKVCKSSRSSTKKRTLLKDALVCDSRTSIKKSLKSNLSHSLAKMDACFQPPARKDYPDCFCLNSNFTARIIKEYPTVKIDGYYQIKDDQNNILYIRKSDVR